MADDSDGNGTDDQSEIRSKFSDLFSFGDSGFLELSLDQLIFEEADALVDARVRRLQPFAEIDGDTSILYGRAIVLTKAFHESNERIVSLLKQENSDVGIDDRLLVIAAYMKIKTDYAKSAENIELTNAYPEIMGKLFAEAKDLILDMTATDQDEQINNYLEKRLQGRPDIEIMSIKNHCVAILFMKKSLKTVVDMYSVFLVASMIVRGYFYFYVVNVSGSVMDRQIMEKNRDKIIEKLSAKSIEALPVIGQVFGAAKDLFEMYKLLTNVEAQLQSKADDIKKSQEFISQYVQSLILWNAMHRAVSDPLYGIVDRKTEVLELLIQYHNQEPG